MLNILNSQIEPVLVAFPVTMVFYASIGQDAQQKNPIFFIVVFILGLSLVIFAKLT